MTPDREQPTGAAHANRRRRRQPGMADFELIDPASVPIRPIFLADELGSPIHRMDDDLQCIICLTRFDSHRHSPSRSSSSSLSHPSSSLAAAGSSIPIRSLNATVALTTNRHETIGNCTQQTNSNNTTHNAPHDNARATTTNEHATQRTRAHRGENNADAPNASSAPSSTAPPVPPRPSVSASASSRPSVGSPAAGVGVSSSPPSSSRSSRRRAFLPCAHSFHESCIRQWFRTCIAKRQEQCCPTCRHVPTQNE